MYSTLFLGDSYTIGEGVPLSGNYPYQTIGLLRQTGYTFYAPEIVARTGWTTGELMGAIRQTTLLPSYSFVMLLIGVNNQYRGLDSRLYTVQFAELLEQACGLAGDPRHVIVLSIPDWGVSPYAANRDRNKIAHEIDEYNAIAREISDRQHTAFIDITIHSRTAGADPAAFVADRLHPATTTYGHWAEQVAEWIIGRL